MTNDERNPKPECPIALSCAVAGFVLRISSFLGISSFVIRVSESRFMGRPLSLCACIRTMTDQIRTAGGPRPQRPRKDQGVSDLPGVLARPTRCDRGPVAVLWLDGAVHGAMAGSWRASTLFLARIGTMNLCGPCQRYGVRLQAARAA